MIDIEEGFTSWYKRRCKAQFSKHWVYAVTVFTDDIIVLSDGERTSTIKWSHMYVYIPIYILQIENQYIDDVL